MRSPSKTLKRKRKTMLVGDIQQTVIRPCIPNIAAQLSRDICSIISTVFTLRPPDQFSNFLYCRSCYKTVPPKYPSVALTQETKGCVASRSSTVHLHHVFTCLFCSPLTDSSHNGYHRYDDDRRLYPLLPQPHFYSMAGRYLLPLLGHQRHKKLAHEAGRRVYGTCCVSGLDMVVTSSKQQEEQVKRGKQDCGSRHCNQRP